MRAKLWIKNSLTCALAGVAASVGYALMMCLMDPELLDPERLLNMASGYLVGIGTVLTVMVGIMDYKITLPLALSFGSTRKEALVGMQLGRLASALVFLGASAVLFVVNGGWDALFVMVPLGIFLLLASGAVGAVFGMVVVRFGKAAGIVVGILIGAMTALCVFAAIFSLSGGSAGGEGSGWLWLLPVLGAAVYGTVLAFERRTVYNYNVKL